MTITREDLEMAAKAAGLQVEWDDASMAHTTSGNGNYLFDPIWRPHEDDGDCARMCAAVGIDTEWSMYEPLVVCLAQQEKVGGTLAWFRDHANDKCAAWRYASVKLAAAVGRAM